MARILVIDDEISIRLTIQTILKRKGHNVVLAECDRLAVDATEAFSFDVILLNFFVPGLDGLETIKVLRNSAPEVPIVIIAGYRFPDGTGGIPDFIRTALSFGANSYLSKPFKPSEIVEVVERSCCAGSSAQSAT
jgi:CheY-like chemotaxis protein